MRLAFQVALAEVSYMKYKIRRSIWIRHAYRLKNRPVGHGFSIQIRLSYIRTGVGIQLVAGLDR
jgi:hypothetical protein